MTWKRCAVVICFLPIGTLLSSLLFKIAYDAFSSPREAAISLLGIWTILGLYLGFKCLGLGWWKKDGAR